MHACSSEGSALLCIHFVCQTVWVLLRCGPWLLVLWWSQFPLISLLSCYPLLLVRNLTRKAVYVLINFPFQFTFSATSGVIDLNKGFFICKWTIHLHFPIIIYLIIKCIIIAYLNCFFFVNLYTIARVLRNLSVFSLLCSMCLGPFSLYSCLITILVSPI